MFIRHLGQMPLIFLLLLSLTVSFNQALGWIDFQANDPASRYEGKAEISQTSWVFQHLGIGKFDSHGGTFFIDTALENTLITKKEGDLKTHGFIVNLVRQAQPLSGHLFDYVISNNQTKESLLYFAKKSNPKEKLICPFNGSSPLTDAYFTPALLDSCYLLEFKKVAAISQPKTAATIQWNVNQLSKTPDKAPYYEPLASLKKDPAGFSYQCIGLASDKELFGAYLTSILAMEAHHYNQNTGFAQLFKRKWQLLSPALIAIPVWLALRKVWNLHFPAKQSRPLQDQGSTQSIPAKKTKRPASCVSREREVPTSSKKPRLGLGANKDTPENVPSNQGLGASPAAPNQANELELFKYYKREYVLNLLHYAYTRKHVIKCVDNPLRKIDEHYFLDQIATGIFTDNLSKVLYTLVKQSKTHILDVDANLIKNVARDGLLPNIIRANIIHEALKETSSLINSDSLIDHIDTIADQILQLFYWDQRQEAPQSVENPAQHRKFQKEFQFIIRELCSISAFDKREEKNANFLKRNYTYTYATSPINFFAILSQAPEGIDQETRKAMLAILKVNVLSEIHTRFYYHNLITRHLDLRSLMLLNGQWQNPMLEHLRDPMNIYQHVAKMHLTKNYNQDDVIMSDNCSLDSLLKDHILTSWDPTLTSEKFWSQKYAIKCEIARKMLEELKQAARTFDHHCIEYCIIYPALAKLITQEIKTNDELARSYGKHPSITRNLANTLGKLHFFIPDFSRTRNAIKPMELHAGHPLPQRPGPSSPLMLLGA